MHGQFNDIGSGVYRAATNSHLLDVLAAIEIATAGRLSNQRARRESANPIAAAVLNMRIETKFLRLSGPVTLGSLFGDCWLGGWTKHRIYYLVMVCRVTASAIPERRRKT